MNRQRPQAIVITCGEGGHAEQMRRLLLSVDGQHNVPYILIAEGNVTLTGVTNEIIHREQCRSLRRKHADYPSLLSPFRSCISALRILLIAIRVLRNYDVRLVLSTGPGSAIPVGIAGRLLGCGVIHLETWCRFSTRSITGRVMHTIATDFWIQHRSLASLYPRSKFVGLL